MASDPAAVAVAPRVDRWSAWHTVVLLSIVPALGLVGVLLPRAAGSSAQWARLVAWLAILILLVAFCLVLGHGITGLWRGLFIGSLNRLSTSRLQLTLWTVIIVSGWLEASLGNAGLHQVDPLLVTVPKTLWAAMGVSTTSLVGAAGAIKLRGMRGPALSQNLSPSDSSWQDIVTEEELGKEGMVDIGKLQMLVVTIALVLGYGIVLGYSFYTRVVPITALPKINDAFAILLAISHGGYVTKKVLPGLSKKND